MKKYRIQKSFGEFRVPSWDYLSGSPDIVKKNKDFINNEFYTSGDGPD